MIDTIRPVETPEGVELGLVVAGLPVRLLAFLLDLAIRIALISAVGGVLGALGGFGAGIMSVFIFALEWFYPILFEVHWAGQTPGKRALGLRVLHDDGTPVGWSASFVRNTLRSADFLPLAYGFGLVSMLANRDFKRLGDLAAGTLVVYGDETVAAPTALASPTDPDGALPFVATRPLRTDEQRAIVAFAERSPGFSPERRIELANLVEPLTDRTGPDAVARLVGIAHHLLGHRSRP